jgi:nucleoside 2-deoxyribosyltransferase
MKNKPLVYMASPYTKGDRFLNTMAAVARYRELLADGIVNPVCPLLSGLIPSADDTHWDRWIEVDLAILSRCDAVYSFDAIVNHYSCRESSGRDMEVAYAIEKGIPVFKNTAALYEWAIEKGTK